MDANIRKVNSQSSIDSMQLRIPVSDVERFSDCLTDTHHLVNSATGDVVDTLEANRRQVIGSLSMQVKKVRHSKGENIDCLTIGTPAKLLGQDYFDGINSNSFAAIHELINSTGLVDVSLDCLLNNSIATDIDIKKDFYRPNDVDFGKWCRHLKSHAKSTTDIGKGCKVYNNELQGQGIQFGTRKTATISYPFFKIYNKHRELLTKSHEFRRDYLQHYDIDGLSRLEVTIKNSSHIKKVAKLTNCNTSKLLNFSQAELNLFIAHATRVHLDKVTAYRKPNEKLTGMKLSIYRLMVAMLESGLQFGVVENALLADREKKDKQRTRILLGELRQLYMSTENSFTGGEKELIKALGLSVGE